MIRTCQRTDCLSSIASPFLTINTQHVTVCTATCEAEQYPPRLESDRDERGADAASVWREQLPRDPHVRRKTAPISSDSQTMTSVRVVVHFLLASRVPCRSTLLSAASTHAHIVSHAKRNMAPAGRSEMGGLNGVLLGMGNPLLDISAGTRDVLRHRTSIGGGGALVSCRRSLARRFFIRRVYSRVAVYARTRPIAYVRHPHPRGGCSPPPFPFPPPPHTPSCVYQSSLLTSPSPLCNRSGASSVSGQVRTQTEQRHSGG